MDLNSPESPKPEELYMEGTAQSLIDGLLHDNVIYVIGVGGCGCNTVEYIADQKLKNVKTIAINTDERVLGDLNVDRQMLIGKELTDGKGAEGDPAIGKRAAEMNEEQILKTLDGADFVIVVAGLGGGTGSGASYVISDLARRNGKMVISYAIMPFSVEKNRYKKAEIYRDKLSAVTEAMTVFENDKTLIHRNKSPEFGFELAGKMLHEVVKNLRMDYITEFFKEVGLDAFDLSETLSDFERELEESEKEAEKPPVLEALEYVENDQSNKTLDSYLETYS
ncbi:MAG: hypothetical protein ACOC85_02210 [Thermoplasmatota archaeon]